MALLVTSGVRNRKLWRCSTSFSLLAAGIGVLSKAVVGWTGRDRLNLTTVLHLAPFQTPTSPQIKAAVAAMCIEFGPFLRVSCSYQRSDKLISQALTSAELPTGPHSDKSWPHLLFPQCLWLNEKSEREVTRWLKLSRSSCCSKIKYVVFRSLKQTWQPWDSWWGVFRLQTQSQSSVKIKMCLWTGESPQKKAVSVNSSNLASTPLFQWLFLWAFH